MKNPIFTGASRDSRGGRGIVFLCSLCFLLFNSPALALDRITATITVIAATANNDTLVVNGVTRTWKTQPVSTVATQIGVTNSIGAVATNLFNHLAAYPFAGSLVLERSGTNGVTLTTLLSGSMAASLAGTTWCTITLSTQTIPVLQVVRVPMSSMPLPASDRTNQASLLTTALSAYSTNSIAAAAVVNSNFVNNATEQADIAGGKVWTGTNQFAKIVSTPIVSATITSSTFSGTTVAATTDIQVAAGGTMSTASRGKLKFDSDGVLTLSNDAQTSFGRLQLGGITSSFPAIKRSGTGLLIRLADDSADANVGLGTLTIGGGTAIAKVMSATATLDFGSTLTSVSTDLTITVTGAADGDPVQIGVPAGSVNADSCFTAWVSSANTVTVRFSNYSAGSINPASGTFRAVVTHF
jgi:hypothetical protein